MNERDFPHVVQLWSRPGWPGFPLEAMSAWHRERGLQQYRGRSGRQEERDFTVHCFADPETADAFAAAFDGERYTAPSR